TVHMAPESEWTDMHWEVFPEGLHRVLTRVHREYGPAAMMVTENGIACGPGPDASGQVADVRRVTYLHDHLAACADAMADGVPLEAYFAWSLFDNFEWERGYFPRFGIVWVDYETQDRIPKASAEYYTGVIRHRTLS
ncbi:MAG: family 1 glycosylhydrolase, partial [Myxococcota bacterium]